MLPFVSQVLKYHNQSIQWSLQESSPIKVITKNWCVVEGERSVALMEHLSAIWCYLWDLLHFCINDAHSHRLNLAMYEVVTYMLLKRATILLGLDVYSKIGTFKFDIIKRWHEFPRIGAHLWQL